MSELARARVCVCRAYMLSFKIRRTSPLGRVQRKPITAARKANMQTVGTASHPTHSDTPAFAFARTLLRTSPKRHTRSKRIEFDWQESRCPTVHQSQDLPWPWLPCLRWTELALAHNYAQHTGTLTNICEMWHSMPELDHSHTLHACS